MIARQCNLSVLEVEQLPPDLYYRYALVSVPREVTQFSRDKDEAVEWIEEYILGTDYSLNRELREKASNQKWR